MNESDSATSFRTMARPLHFIRVRLFRGGQAEWLRDLLRDEQETLMEDLAKMRGEKVPEQDDRIVDLRDQLGWLIDALKDIDRGLIELAGPNEDPR